MGGRTDKGRAVTNYLTGSTGIPSLLWDGNRGSIDAPRPYVISVTTARKLQEFHDLIREEHKGTHIAIRYDRGMDSVADAWVGMTLHNFAPLLQTHYEITRRGNE